MKPLFLQLGTVLAFATIVVATWAFGRASLRRLGGASLWSEPHSRIAWELALGLLAWGVLLTVLGLFGLLYSSLIQGLTLAAAAWGVVELRRAWRNGVAAAGKTATTDEPLPRWLGGLCVGCAIVAAVASLLAALAPPLAGDALCYHLELPKRFLADHGLTFFRDNDNATFPLLTEMWFLWGLAVDGPITAQLMHWLCGILTAGATYTLAVPYVGRSWSFIASSVALLAPGINNQMTAPLNDVALAMFTTLTLAAWLRATTEADRTVRAKWLRLLGLMLGGALAVKYTALVFAAVSCVVIAMTIQRLRPSSRGEWIRGACAAAIVAVVVAGPWYLRAAYYRGDPLYPFLSTQATEGAPSTFPESKRPLGRGLGVLVEAPWAMTMEPERFGGRAHQLGPLFLAFVPCLAIAARRRELRALIVVTALYGTACVLLRQNVRFLFPLVPILAVIVAAVLREIMVWEPTPRRMAFAALGGLVLFITVIPVARVRSTAAVAIGLESREAFLTRREPTFAAADWINRNLPADAFVLSQEQRAFYFAPSWTRENVYRRHTGYNRPTFGSTAPLEADLKAAGFTHLFLAEKPVDGLASNVPVGYDATLSTLADTAMAARPESGPQLVREWRSEVDGETRRYRLLLLR